MPLSLGFGPLESLVGDLDVGNLVLLRGPPVLTLAHSLCARAQLPGRKGGLDSPALWLDGGNVFSPYCLGELSKGLGLDPERALNRVYLSRAFTCYQMSSLVLEKLWGAAWRFGARLVVISELARLYTESDIPKREAERAFVPVLEALRASPGRRDVLICITELGGAAEGGKLDSMLASIADIVLRMRERRLGIEARLEKHPTRRAKLIRLGPEVLGVVPLDEFAGGEAAG